MTDADDRPRGAPDWAALAERRWRRQKWRLEPGAEALERCAACGLPIHRPGTYYLRPAYTDGRIWLCGNCHRALVRRTGGREGNQYRSRRDAG